MHKQKKNKRNGESNLEPHCKTTTRTTNKQLNPNGMNWNHLQWLKSHQFNKKITTTTTTATEINNDKNTWSCVWME